MKALFLISVAQPGHTPLRAERERRALEAAGWETASIRSHFVVPPEGFLQRARAYLRMCRAVVVEIILEGSDIIIAHDIEMLRPAVIAGRRMGVPVLYDAHEDWPKLIAHNSRLESVAASAIEWWYGRRVAHVLAVHETVARRFPRATVFYNANYSDEIHPADREGSRKALGYAPDDLVWGYIGAVGHLRGFVPLLDAFAKQDKVLLVVRSDGVNDMLALGMEKNVQVYFNVPPDGLGKYYAAMDVGLVLLRDDDKNERMALPNKVFEYMAYGLPVYAPVWAENVIRVIVRVGCGLGALGAGEAGRKAFLETYAWENQAPKFMRIVNGAVKK